LRSIDIQCPQTNSPQTNTIFGKIFYPALIVDVYFPSLSYQPFEFILDSGADCTMVPRTMATLAGVQLPEKPDAYVTGIARRRMPAYSGKLKMRIGQEEFEIRCLFTESDRTPFLLGRVDFFSIFDIAFDGNSCTIVLARR